MSQYTAALLNEIEHRSAHIPDKDIYSLYLGGGTPSLLPPHDILTLRSHLANAGFKIDPSAEITLEINPGTIDETKLALYLEAGINRYSVGVQTFNESALKELGREHSADESRRTLQFLLKNKLPYSFDLLFGFPGQTLASLELDLVELLKYEPEHVSLYNLTVPEKHFLNKNRAEDDVQAQMFDVIDRRLATIGLQRYELSNFARPGHESKHNKLYWTDQSYWGLGVSAHSYLRSAAPYGVRFWNPSYHKHYLTQSSQSWPAPFWRHLPTNQGEILSAAEALTDFCHTQLRLVSGLEYAFLAKKFGPESLSLVKERAQKLLSQGTLSATTGGFALSALGRPIANQIFLEFTFLPNELPQSLR